MSRDTDVSADSEQALTSTVAQQPMSVAEAGTKNALVTRRLLQNGTAPNKGKMRQDRSSSSRELCELDDVKIADCLTRSLSRGGPTDTLPTARTVSFGNTGQDDA